MGQGPEVRWYSGRLLYERLYGEEDESPDEALFEEKVVVFRCGADDDVLSRLKVIAKRDDDEYRAIAGNMVRWVFREVLEIQDIMGYGIEDGTEVYFRWWTDPTERDFEIIRYTHEEPWWQDDPEP